MGLLGRDQFQWRAVGVGHMQRAALKWHVDKVRFDARTVEMRLGLDEVVVGEHAKAHALATGSPLVFFSVRLWWQRSSTPCSQIVSSVSSLTTRPMTSV